MTKREMLEQSIYLITVFEKLEPHDRFGFDLGSRRSVGFTYDFEMAENVVRSNMLDIWETCYDYACIEELRHGLYPIALSDERVFYKYNRDFDCYERTPEPMFMKMKGPIGGIG